jgi:hypothetical protein
VFLADDRATLTALSPKDGIADWNTDALGSEFEFPAEVTVHAHGGGITVSSVPWGTVAVLDSATGGVARTPIRYDAASTGVPGSGDADLVVISSAEILEQTRHQPASRQSSQWTITVYGLD